MKDAVFVTGNPNKAKYFSEMVGLDVPDIRIDVEEIQSLDIRVVVEHKVRQAYEQAYRPVVVEDTRLVFLALGNLPGTYIKWFMSEIGQDGLCKMLDAFDGRAAIAGTAIAYYDGTTLEIFEKSLEGTITETPAGESGFGWNDIFIPKGSEKTLGQMDEEEFKVWYEKIKPFSEIAEFLKS